MPIRLIDNIKPTVISDPSIAEEITARLREATSNDEDRNSADELIAAMSENAALNQLICGIFAGSFFLSNIIANKAGFAWSCLNGNPDEQIGLLTSSLWPHIKSLQSDEEVMAYLRHRREEAALLVALCDLAGFWPVMVVTRKLSEFADAATSAAVNYLLLKAARKGDVLGSSEDDPSSKSGYGILGLGKLGAYELNYSSDIDIIVLYDPETAPLKPGIEPSVFFVRLTRDLVKLLQEQTADGYAFRVDLRLRPDPGATSVAIGLEAAGQYYENLGQNWERAAMIKARGIAGDDSVIQAFIERLQPFIWRKHLDYATIADIHAMKRQIHSHKGHGQVAVAGHNIKLGRGGIREIEFFAQTQQLIAGGRVAELRTQKTLETLDKLAGHNWISTDAADDMTKAYLVLRHIEHRLQMRNDEQTHTLPKEDAALEGFARFAGFDNAEIFAQSLIDTLSIVQSHYAALFEDAPDLDTQEGSLVFTGGEDDPDTLETLRVMGFEQVSGISNAIRAWHFGRFAATRSARSREILTELIPKLLRVLAKTAHPDAAFGRFDGFLQALPAGIQLFSLLRANPNLLDLLATIMGTAPRLASVLGTHSGVLDAVLDPGFFSETTKRSDLDSLITDKFSASEGFEEVLDCARIIGHDQMFRIGVQLLSNVLDPLDAGQAYADLAESLIAALVDQTGEEMAKAHGQIKGGRIAILGMGKLGGREMAASSDLDLMMIYDYDDDAGQSDGTKSLDGVTYYTRYIQRLISALSVPTAEGPLYEVDMRLRPSGRSGPIATRFSSFAEYQKKSAWTWEHMALTRARLVAGNDEFCQEIKAVIAKTLQMPREPKRLITDVREMRLKIDQEKHSDNIWDIKHVRGGLLDLEFICQYLQLAHGNKNPDIFVQNTGLAFSNLTQAGLMKSDQSETLLAAYRMMSTLSQMMRLCVEGNVNAEAIPEDLKSLLARTLNIPDFARLSAHLKGHQNRVKTLFDQIIN